jgi:hypothetical protein
MYSAILQIIQVILNNLFHHKYVIPHRLIGALFQQYRNTVTKV